MNPNNHIIEGIPTTRIQKALVVCTGPSVRSVDWEVLRDLDATIFAVNYALYHVPRADYWFSFDSGIISRKIKFRLSCTYVAALATSHEAAKSAMRRFPDGSHHVQRVLEKDADSPGFLFDGRLPCDSGFSCINLAIMMGAKKIAVVGFDCTLWGHFYEDDKPCEQKTRVAAGRADATVEQCRQRGIEILNGSPASRCTSWPRCAPEDAIRWIGGKQ